MQHSNRKTRRMMAAADRRAARAQARDLEAALLVLDRAKTVMIYATGEEVPSAVGLAVDRDWRVAATYEEEACLGRASEQPQFKRMMADVLGRDDVDTIVVAGDSEFTRSFEESRASVRSLARKGVRLVMLVASTQPATQALGLDR